MSLVPTESVRFETMEKVVDLDLEGLNPTQISKRVGIQRKEVIKLLDEYRIALSSDQEARDLARDYLNKMVAHYNKLIKAFYDLISELEGLGFSHQVAGQKNAALKAIADLEAKRLDALQKAGLLDSAELGDELAEMEEKQQILVDILRTDLCPDCRMRIAHKLTKVTGKVEPMAEYEVEVVDA
jgi:hypothetical protein